MTLNIPFDNSYVRLPERFFTRLNPTPVTSPALISFNADLAAELQITPGTDTELASVFAGNTLPEGAQPIATAYAGHQFGGFSPQLGDGRAHLLGEVININGLRRDIQLKGSGRTPWSRGGDGRAWLGPVLREYVVSEAMHALGIPTSRALAAVTTGDDIIRETGALPGAILTRVASSHIRVGTFEYFAARRDKDALQTLLDYAISRHYPDCETPLEFLNAVIDAQAKLVAKWLSVGFIHGVMNTDNTTISGETIDYGPCAFIDIYHPQTVFSSIDARGRYAYDNQAHVIVWNMAQLASSLLYLMQDQDTAIKDFTQAVHAMPDLIQGYWLHYFGHKIGLEKATPDDKPLITDLLDIMTAQKADFTNSFRDIPIDEPAYTSWNTRWQARLKSETGVRARLHAANPAFIPRNHRIEQMIEAAVAGDFNPFERLTDVLARPFEDQPEARDLTHPPLPGEVVESTFCGT
jgi:uncharacterized protein YdiU (UPF0061 family)